MARLLLGMLAGLALGLGVGFALFSAQPIHQGLAPRAGAVQAASPSQQASLETPTAQAPESGLREVAPARPGASQVPVTDARLQAVLARTETTAVEPLEGAGEIWGEVKDLDRAGLEGVVLRAQASDADAALSSAATVGQSPPELSLENAVREAAQRYVERRAGLFETRSGAGGRFRFEGLPEGQYRLRAYKRDYVIEMRSRNRWMVSTGAEVDFVATPVSSLPVQVALPDGTQPERAVILCTDDRSGDERKQRYAWSPTDAVLRLPAGDVELMALAGVFSSAAPWNEDAAAMRSQSVQVELVPGAPPAPVELQLEARTGVRGLVVFSDDQVGGSPASVRLLALADGETVDLGSLANAEPSAWIGRGSEYTFLDLAPGRYALGVTRTWSGPVAAQRVVDVGSGITRCDIVVPPIDPEDYLVVRVYGNDSEPLSGVRFGFRHEDSGGRSSSSSGMSGMRGEDGSYYVTVPDSAREAYYGGLGGDDSFSLRAIHEKHGEKSVPLTHGQTEAVVRFSVPAQLEVTVTGYVGSIYLGRVALVATRDGGGRNYFGARGGRPLLGPDGVKRFDALEPGSYVLSLLVGPASGPRRSYPSNTVATLAVQLRAGENAFQMALPPLYTLDVVVPGAKQGNSVRLSRQVEGEGRGWGNSWNQRCDAEGRVQFEDLPAGSFSINTRAGEKRGSMRVEVPSGTILFEPDQE